MFHRSAITRFILLVVFCLALGCLAQTTHSDSSPGTKENMVTAHAAGPFDVKITPQSDDFAKSASLARMTIDKQFHGDLEATSKGEMLAFGTGQKGSSGGYVALEQVTGTLQGRSGTFVLQHSATMNRGVPQLSITVVPDSGTGQLTGIAGSMNIIIVEGKHSYDFEYTLPK